MVFAGRAAASARYAATQKSFEALRSSQGTCRPRRWAFPVTSQRWLCSAADALAPVEEEAAWLALRQSLPPPSLSQPSLLVDKEDAESQPALRLQVQQAGYQEEALPPVVVEEWSPPAEDAKPLVLAEEVAPAGKHQGKCFQEIVEDMAFCKWICSDQRRGWMALLKVYLETEHGFQEPEPTQPEEVDLEEAANQAALAEARAKLKAKAAGKG